MPKPVRTSLVCAATAAIALHGCAGRHDLESPDRVLTRYAAAIADHDYRDAYALLAERTRATLTYSEFVATLELDPEATRARLASLRQAPTSIETESRIVVDGEVVTMPLERGAFRIEGNPAAVFDQHSPRAAVRSFVHALETRQAGLVLRLAPPVVRSSLDETSVEAALGSESRAAYEELAASLRAAIDAPISEVGTTATMRFGGDRTLRLIQVDSLWYIDAVD